MTNPAQLNGHAQASGQTLVQRAMEALDRGDATTAVAWARNAADSAPNDALVWAVLCMALHRAGRFDSAIDAGRTSIALNPASAEFHSNLGVVLRAAHRPREAEAAYLAAIAADAKFVSAYSNYANLARDEGRHQVAEQYYRAALALNPDSAEAWQALSGVLQRQGRASEAGAAFMFSYN